MATSINFSITFLAVRLQYVRWYICVGYVYANNTFRHTHTYCNRAGEKVMEKFTDCVKKANVPGLYSYALDILIFNFCSL